MHDNPKYPACIARKLYSYSKGVDSGDVEPSVGSRRPTRYSVIPGFRMRSLLKSHGGRARNLFSAPAPPQQPANSTKLASQ